MTDQHALKITPASPPPVRLLSALARPVSAQVMLALITLALTTISYLLGGPTPVIFFALVAAALLSNLILSSSFTNTACSLFSLLFIAYPATFGISGYWGSNYDYFSHYPLILCATFNFMVSIGVYCAALAPTRKDKTTLPSKNAPGSATALIFASFAAALIVYFTLNVGTFTQTRYQNSFDFIAAAGRLSVFDRFLRIDIPKAFAFATFFVALLNRRAAPKRMPLIVLLATFLAYVLMNNPLSTPRQVLISQAFAVVISLGMMENHPRKVWTAAISGMVFLGPILDYFSRGRFYGAKIQILRGPEFDTYQNSEAFFNYISNVGFQHGRHLTRTMSFFLPKSLKFNSEDLTSSVAIFNSYRQQNISLPAFNELYADFGYLSLVIGSVIFGFILGNIETAQSRPPTGKGKVSIALQASSIYLLAGIFPLLRGPWLGNLPFIAFTVGAIFVVSFATNYRPAQQ